MQGIFLQQPRKCATFLARVLRRPGNIALMGIVDFAEIRSNCTEVTLAVHYEIKNKLFAWLDRHRPLDDPAEDEGGRNTAQHEEARG